MKRAKDTSDLLEIPGVGPSIGRDLRDLGIGRVADLKGKSPEALYRRLMKKRGRPIDRCVLYVFRCAVYYAGRRTHDPGLLKWWNWKEKKGETA